MNLTTDRIIELNRRIKNGAEVYMTLASGNRYQVKSLGNQLNDMHGRPDPTICEVLEVWLVIEKRTLRIPADQVTSLEAK